MAEARYLTGYRTRSQPSTFHKRFNGSIVLVGLRSGET